MGSPRHTPCPVIACAAGSSLHTHWRQGGKTHRLFQSQIRWLVVSNELVHWSGIRHIWAAVFRRDLKDLKASWPQSSANVCLPHSFSLALPKKATKTAQVLDQFERVECQGLRGAQMPQREKEIFFFSFFFSHAWWHPLASDSDYLWDFLPQSLSILSFPVRHPSFSCLSLPHQLLHVASLMCICVHLLVMWLGSSGDRVSQRHSWLSQIPKQVANVLVWFFWFLYLLIFKCHLKALHYKSNDKMAGNGWIVNKSYW